MPRDHYTVLGIGRDASQSEIKQAYRERALECHPDRAAEDRKAAAKDEFLRVRKAFDVLSNPKTRAAYDANGSDANGASTRNGRAPDRPRPQSFKEQWRAHKSKRVRVRASVFENIDGLWVDQKAVDRRTSVAVPLFGLIGFGLFLYDPHYIYATDIFLIDLALCTLLGAAHGYVLGSAWAYLDLAWERRS
ncbi:MAG: J domain-containing protein [Salinivenus sp.]